MSKLEMYTNSFKVSYEKFIIACDSQEEIKGWDIEEDGEMESFYTNILVTVILKLIAADGKFTEEEAKYFNESFSFDYTVEELQEIYENCEQEIEEGFKEEIEEAVEKLERANDCLADYFKELLGYVGKIIAESDGITVNQESGLLSLVESFMQ